MVLAVLDARCGIALAGQEVYLNVAGGLRITEPAADLAWLRPEPSFPDTASLQIAKIEPRAEESATTRLLRARGLVHDRVSPRMLAQARVANGRLQIGARSYPALLIDSLPVAEPALARRLSEIRRSSSPCSGTANSAAAEGVGARTSAT